MDADLPVMEALQAGNESALNELINRHREPLVHFVYRYLHDEACARFRETAYKTILPPVKVPFLTRPLE